jgi:putative tricarboxylic transport membrane protein
MDILHSLALGFSTILTPSNMLFCLLGVLAGQVIGLLPGLGPSAGIALLLPLTFGGDPVGSTIMFAGIYYGAQYGGTLTSVLVNIPGESSSVMTALDGHALARQGRAGAALGIAAIGSFIAGIIGTIGLMVAAPMLARGALAFGPPEYCLLVLMGLAALALVGGSLLKGLMMGALGLLLATIGVDPQIGNARFTFGQIWLLDGVEFLVVAVALFGVGEVLSSVGRDMGGVSFVSGLKNLYPTRDDWNRCRMPILRGTAIGFLVGVLPGAGATIASFFAYITEKRLSKRPEMFGKGAIEGVAAPEAANNASSAGAMVPMFALGLPGSNTTAIMLGALIMFGLQPGPQLFQTNPALVWGIIASMFIGNALLLILNLPLAGLSAQLLRVPYKFMYPGILAFCIAGVYSQSNSIDDVYIMVLFGIAGYFMKHFDYPAAPLVLGLVLEPLLENGLRQSLTLSFGSLSIFVTRPLSLALLVVALCMILFPVFGALLRHWRRQRLA